MPAPNATRAVGRRRWRALVEQVRTSLWLTPTVAIVTGGVLAAALSQIVVDEDSSLGRIIFPGGPASARAVLQAVAGSVITVTGVVFSLTVVTLQLASTQFSPRLLRTFLRDFSNQVVLGTFLATFTYSVVTLRAVRSETSGEEALVPALAISGAYVLAGASVFALVYFIDHIARSIRIDTLMRKVNEDTLGVIEYVLGSSPASRSSGPVEPPAFAVDVPSPRSGFVQAIDESALLELATRHGGRVRVVPSVGQQILRGSPLLQCWRSDGQAPPEELPDRAVSAVQLGFERTAQQDVAFGLRQLVDIAVKALSPGINDPTTAVHAIGHLGALLVELADRDLGTRCFEDPGGVLRLVVPAPDLGAYVDLACGQIRRYGAGDPEVTVALLRILRDLLRVGLPPDGVAAVASQAAQVVDAAERETADPRDLSRVHALRTEIHGLLA